MPPLTHFKTTHRNLPHWHAPGATYFLTWRVLDARELEPEDRTITLNAVQFWDNQKWCVYAAVVMTDHAHALVRPLPLDRADPAATAFHDLSGLVQSVKGFSAYKINRRRGWRGPLWQDEGYDRIVRDDREFEETWQYIVYNPVKVGLVEVPERYPWLYQAGRAD
ncbi:REP-associated tyrosine transposase [Frigoriglobus tundricola]|uniref:Transposase IS200-like domain-containing protein n=1 Tax=Frigoriglobus tundricola TaxID=2774151 RepID=A0A6M5YWB3_9BACT|nr:transposase [Frigoriglobus tundricola]QJW97790.1 protein of unknown function DUF1568 [Frigoriglobus tundricola]